MLRRVKQIIESKTNGEGPPDFFVAIEVGNNTVTEIKTAITSTSHSTSLEERKGSAPVVPLKRYQIVFPKERNDYVYFVDEAGEKQRLFVIDGRGYASFISLFKFGGSTKYHLSNVNLEFKHKHSGDYFLLENGKLFFRDAGDKLELPLYYLPINDKRIKKIVFGKSVKPISLTPRLPKPIVYPSFRDRLYFSTIGFHRRRFILGVMLTAIFLCLLLAPPAIMPFAFLTNTAFWLQNTLVPFVSAIGLDVTAKAVIASLGSFLTLTAPKWVGNLCQWTGHIVDKVIAQRILGVPTMMFVAFVDRQRSLPQQSAWKEFLTKSMAVLVGVFIVLPTWLLFSVAMVCSQLLSGLGQQLEGGYGYPRLANSKSTKKEIDKAIESQVKRLGRAVTLDEIDSTTKMIKNFVTSKNPKQTAQCDPAILFPETRYNLSNQLAQCLKWFAKKSPIPETVKFFEERANAAAGVRAVRSR